MELMPAYLVPVRAKIGPLPLILPAALAIILKGDQLILVETADGRVQLPGGMPELDESIEEALLREVWEETGLTVGIEYLLGVYTSQPVDTYQNGHQAKVYLFVFVCNIQGGELVPNHKEEIARIRLEDPNSVSKYNQIISDYKSGKRGFVR